MNDPHKKETITKLTSTRLVLEKVPRILKQEKPSVRYLKLRSFYSSYIKRKKIVPELRLCGDWLQRAGFMPEGYVTITVMDGLLLIRTAEEKE